MKKQFIIIGAGPTGIGAAMRLEEFGITDYLVMDASKQAGGLSASFIDDQGFTWDLGGHVQFSHYEIFDEYMDLALGKDGWYYHRRESWIWIRDRFVPYPFQYNLHRLPSAEKWNCVQGLLAAVKSSRNHPKNFREWILETFGPGVAETFLFPYNLKVWASPLELMDFKWVGDRVAVPELDKVMKGICLEEDQVSWGPNHKFRFPKFGGTGAIWQALAARIPADNQRLSRRVTRIDPEQHTLQTANGEGYEYDYLISTIPLDYLVEQIGDENLIEQAKRLLYSGVHVVGIGLEGAPPEHLKTKCWMYFPEGNNPFYRVTVFSNYSPNNTPRPGATWSLMAEVSQSKYKSVDMEGVVDDVIQGMIATKLITTEDKIISKWHRFLNHGYPIPSTNRDSILEKVLPTLEEMDIYSRGRFGAWKYEVGNMDHSFMQGWGCVNRILNGGDEQYEPTLNHANRVNGKYQKRENGIPCQKGKTTNEAAIHT
ncbi:MAG: FAD-dependent oxidoreductase [Candidatus Omnitrophica bacterium]|nr:FAD-dependent oxidoreductase [Candidatus Omnitrophota bacterium]